MITGFYYLDRTAQVLDKVQDIHKAIIRPVPVDNHVTKEDILGEFYFVFLIGIKSYFQIHSFLYISL